MAEEEAQSKWVGNSVVELRGATADQTWPFLEDFCNLHKCFPNIDTCYQVEGEVGHPGLVRYCGSTPPASADGSETETETRWAKERLLMINPKERCLSYQVIENNVGFKSYVANLKVLPISDCDVDGDGHEGCKIEWSFVADPVEGWRSEDLSSYVDYCLEFMAKRIEETVSVEFIAKRIEETAA